MKLFLIIFLFLLGCAEPKYVNSLASNPVTTSAAADCSIQFVHSRLCLSWFWEKIPTSTATGSLIFKIYRLNQFDQSSVEMDLSVLPQVTLWMPDMGHGSTPTQVSQLDTGTYRASEVFFVMPGLWQIKFQESTIDEAVATYTF